MNAWSISANGEFSRCFVTAESDRHSAQLGNETPRKVISSSRVAAILPINLGGTPPAINPGLPAPALCQASGC